MNTFEKLIKLFSENSIEAIERNGGTLLLKTFGKTSYQSLLEIPDYMTVYTRVLEKRKEIDSNVSELKDRNNQINACLRLLYEFKEDDSKDEEEYRTLKSLIRNILYHRKWNDKEKKIFDKKYNIIMNWQHYFLSYTNRDATTTSEEFRSLIRTIYKPLPPRWTENFVAKIIVRCLSENNLKGYFDYDNTKCGDDIEDEIRKHCQGSFAFLQLIETRSFRKPDGDKKNWCFEEYEEFRRYGVASEPIGKQNRNRFYFLLTEEIIETLKPAILPKTYQPWYDHIARLKYLSLAGIKDYRGFRAKFRKVVEGIANVREQFIDNILSN